MSRLCHVLSSDFWRTLWRKLRRLDSCASSRLRTTGFGRVGREANLNFGGCMGDDCTWRCGSAFLSIGESGDEARMGDEDSGDGTTGRWSHAPKMGVGENDSMFPAGTLLSFDRCIRLEAEDALQGAATTRRR